MRCNLKILTAASAVILLATIATSAVAGTVNSTASTQNAAIRAAEAWAFPEQQSPDTGAPNAPAPKANPRQVVHVAGSTRAYTQAQIDNSIPDWFPQDHPPMPRVVAHGDKPALACALCHNPDGRGGPEAAALTGLPEAYILEQVAAFRSGDRGKGPWPTTQNMTREALNATDADLQQAAVYFSKLKFIPQTQVIETASVPKTHWEDYVLVPDKSGAREPIGERIVEMPVDFRLYELGDEHSGYIAWVPPGSIARGAVIATKGVGTALSCESCHGAGLQGVGNIPPLAGRSPTYIVRELILFRNGKRTNPAAAPMRQEASHLTLKDMIDSAAYAASRQ
ncbi:MAG: c-type cytochrome [Gammaproteobacteria bacterium]